MKMNPNLPDKPNNQSITPPPWAEKAGEIARAFDRQRLESCPIGTEYTRRVIEWEFWPLQFDDDTLVRVTQFGHGIRSREVLAAQSGQS